MKYIDGFDTENAEETTPDGHALIAHYPTGTKFTAVTMLKGGGAYVVHTYDEHGGIADWAIPQECRDGEAMTSKESHLFGEICRISGMVEECLSWDLNSDAGRDAMAKVIGMIKAVCDGAIEKAKGGVK